MWKNIQKKFVAPLIIRAGAASSMWLVAKGVEPDLAAQLEIGIIALGFLASDVLLDLMNRKAS